MLARVKLAPWPRCYAAHGSTVLITMISEQLDLRSSSSTNEFHDLERPNVATDSGLSEAVYTSMSSQVGLRDSKDLQKKGFRMRRADQISETKSVSAVPEERQAHRQVENRKGEKNGFRRCNTAVNLRLNSCDFLDASTKKKGSHRVVGVNQRRAGTRRPFQFPSRTTHAHARAHARTHEHPRTSTHASLSLHTQHRVKEYRRAANLFLCGPWACSFLDVGWRSWLSRCLSLSLSVWPGLPLLGAKRATQTIHLIRCLLPWLPLCVSRPPTPPLLAAALPAPALLSILSLFPFPLPHAIKHLHPLLSPFSVVAHLIHRVLSRAHHYHRPPSILLRHRSRYRYRLLTSAFRQKAALYHVDPSSILLRSLSVSR